MASPWVPITDEQAKAIQEAAKFGGEALETLRGVGGFVRDALGDVPENLVGLLGGDWLRNRRLINLAKAAAKVREQLKAHGVEKPEPISLTLALPMIQAAADESREELQELWARLIAAAMDPKRASKVRRSYIATLKLLDPLDALMLQSIVRNVWQIGPRTGVSAANIDFDGVANSLWTTSGEVEVSLQNLVRCECAVGVSDNLRVYQATTYGRLLLGALQD